jgi:hypothetical protein
LSIPQFIEHATSPENMDPKDKRESEHFEPWRVQEKGASLVATFLLEISSFRMGASGSLQKWKQTFFMSCTRNNHQFALRFWVIWHAILHLRWLW